MCEVFTDFFCGIFRSNIAVDFVHDSMRSYSVWQRDISSPAFDYSHCAESSQLHAEQWQARKPSQNSGNRHKLEELFRSYNQRRKSAVHQLKRISSRLSESVICLHHRHSSSSPHGIQSGLLPAVKLRDGHKLREQRAHSDFRNLCSQSRVNFNEPLESSIPDCRPASRQEEYPR